MIESHVKTKEGKEPITAYSVDEVVLPTMTFKRIQRNHKIIQYASSFMTLDTETSHLDHEVGWVYQWAAKIKNTYIYGRTPDEIVKLLNKIAEIYNLNDKKRFIIYIHNMSYDIQYLKHYLKEYDPFMKVLAIDRHSIITCDILGFRILCSYKLTNLSLSTLAKNYSTKYVKAVGEIDYNIIRFQDTPLKYEDWFYMFSDVASQYDGIEGFLHAMGYKYACDAPFTSTGFVRNACRKASKADKSWRDIFVKTQLSLEQYNLCRWAFQGGVCIASFVYAGQTIREDLGHVDFTSSYPCQQMTKYFPVGAPTWYGDIEDQEELEYLLNKYCCVFELTLFDVHIKKGVTAPCIPSSKCVGLVEPVRINGKVVYAKQLTIAVTEIDYKWICKQYTAKDVKVSNMLIFEKGVMPDWLKNEIMYYYKNKCELKGVDDLLYAKSKAFLNSIYGMTATQIIRDEYELDEELMIEPKSYEDMKEAMQNKIDKYYRSYNSFMPYQFAIYTTAWARNELFTMIEAVGYDKFLYCDTDSVFYIKTPENEKRLEEYRQHTIDLAIKCGAYVGNKYLGEPTPEAPIRAFRALHSKCYAMEELNEKTGEYELNVVIAGINKAATFWKDGKSYFTTNSLELGDIDNLKDGFIFEHCGGVKVWYVEGEPIIEDIQGHKTLFASAAIIELSEKEISDTMFSIENGYLINIFQEIL